MSQKQTLVPKLRFPEFRDAWNEAELSDVADIVGERIAQGSLKLQDYVSTENLLSDFGRITLASNLPATGSVTRFRADDVLVSNIRPYLKKVWAADRDGGASNDVIVIRAKTVVHNDYFACVLRSEAFIAHVMKGAKGVKMPRGDIGLMMEYPVSFPSLAEQRRIADCLSSLDELIAAEGRKWEHLRTYKKGLMQQLFPRVGERVPRLRFPEFRNAGEWEEKPLGEVVDFQTGGTPSKANPAFWKGSIPWVSAKDMKQLCLDDAEDHITAAAVDDGAKLVPGGTVLMLTRGMTLLKDVPICILSREMSFNQDVKALRAKEDLDGRFLAYMLTASKQRLLSMVDVAGHGTGRLDTEELKALNMALPPPTEQRHIAECLSALNAQITAQSEKLAALRTHKKGLMQQLFPSAAEEGAG